MINEKNMTLDAFIYELGRRAAKSGLAEWEIYAAQSESFTAGVFKGQMEQYAVHDSSSLSLRVISQRRIGYAYTQLFNEEALEMLLQCAHENALLTDAGDAPQIWPGSAAYPKADRWNPELAAIDAPQKVQLAFALERAALTDPRVLQTQHCLMQTSAGRVRIVNAYGLDQSSQGNSVMAVLAPIVGQGERRNNATAFYAGREFAAIDPQQLAKESISEAADFLNASPVPTGRYEITLRWDAAAALWSTFWPVFSADAAQKGLSRLAGAVGQSIAAPCVSFLDDPLLPGGLSGGPFDDEGVASYAKHIIRDGQLCTLLHNLKTAQKEGVSSTGNGSKSSVASPVGVAPSNFYLVPGGLSITQLLGRMQDGLYICQLSGLHAGANAVTGDFSLSAKGYLVQGGQIGRAVEQITLAGNFYALLREIQAVADDLRFDAPDSDGCFGSPGVWIGALSVSA